MILVDGRAAASIDARDRGLAYGDGVFRTLRLRGGRALLWRRHYAKLAADAAALGIPAPPATDFEHDLATIIASHPDGSVRLTLTRGSTPRGYRPPMTPQPRRVAAWSAAADDPPSAGVRVRWCRLRLARQPALAGIKHLNRLENVLARAEWNDPAIAEGLLCDAAGDVIGGTMSNLFIVRAGRLVTPPLTMSGIAGVTRGLIIERAEREAMPVELAPLAAQDVVAAEALFLVNSLIGVWPVNALDDRCWPASDWTGRLQQWIADAAREEF